MNLQNDITDNFLDAEYQFNEYSELGLTMSNEVGMVAVPDEEGNEYGAYRSKNFTELTYDPQNEYYD
jgi:hypothetical protein